MRTSGLRLDQAPPLDIPLRFFLTAPLFGMATGVALAVRGGVLLAHPLAPETLALVHGVTLGWVTMVMVGALYQILPVLVGAAVPSISVARWVHAGLTGGTVALAAGLATGSPWALGAAVPMLGLALGSAIVQFSIAVWRARNVAAAAWGIRLALGGLAIAAAAGSLFAMRQAAGNPLSDRTAWIAVHAYWGLAGWIGMLVIGVGSALLPMFYLTSRMPPRTLWSALAAGALAPLSATVLFPLAGSGVAQWIPVGCAILAYALAASAWGRMLRTRRRTASDASLWLWRAALGNGAVACVLLVWHQGAPDPRILLSCGIAYLVGFAAILINAMTLKIVPFLVWLHRFSRAVGKGAVPLMGDLLPARHARRQAIFMIAAAGLLLLAGLLPHDALARIAGAALMLACGNLEWLLWRAWRTKAPEPALAPGGSPPRGPGP